MSIKSAFRLLLLLGGLLIASALLFYAASQSKLAVDTSRSGTWDKIADEGLELVQLSHTVLQYPGPRSISQWQDQFTALSRLLTANPAAREPEVNRIIERVQTRLSVLRPLKEKLIEMRDKAEGESRSSEVAAILSAQLFQEVTQLQANLRALKTESHDALQQAQTQATNRQIGIFLLFTGLSALFGTVVSLNFKSHILKPLNDLGLTIEGIGRGECLRAPIGKSDEISKLMGAFNRLQETLAQREESLKESEFRWKFAIEGSGDGVWDWNLLSDEVKYSKLWKSMLGYADDDILPENQEWVQRIHPDDRIYVASAMQAYLEDETANYVVEYRLRCKDERYKWILGRGMVVHRSAEGKPLRMIGTHTDITHRKQAEADLRISATVFESQEGMLVTDANGVILRVNKAFTETTGYTAADAVGQTPSLLQSGRHSPEFFRDMWETIHRTGGWQGEIWDRRKNGTVYPKWLTISAVKNDEGAVTHYIGTHYDISERKKAEERIKELAFFDQLTGLPNRTLLLDRLTQGMTASTRSGHYGALLFIDLDNFKTLNDTLGHDMGDLLLTQAAQRLTISVRECDTVARLGGDEFVVVLVGLSANEAEAARASEAVAEKILVSLSQSYPLTQSGEIVHHCTASIGVTLFRGHLSTVDDLMKQADLAMYKSKEAGRNALRFFDHAMELAVNKRAGLENDLRQALEKNQFLLHYQAQVASQSLTGAEVLVRWQHPLRGMVSPAEFIPLAEESGLILPLGHWVLQTACAQLAQWSARPEMAHLRLAVNVSAHQFRQRDFVDQVLAVLKNTGANPQRLKLELTESLLVSNVEDIIVKMSALKAQGVGFSLDDFGTGYSSLSYLKRLPLDQLKIDQSFVRDVLIDPNDAAIARTIVTLAESLGLKVIAEGVETAEQRDFLASVGCHDYQGYFFSRPLPIDRFETFAQQTCQRCIS